MRVTASDHMRVTLALQTPHGSPPMAKKSRTVAATRSARGLIDITDVWMHVCMYVCMDGCTYACVCMCACLYTSMYN